MRVYEGQDPRILLAIAARSLAGSLPNIGTLNLSPDLLSSLLGSLLSGPAAPGPSPESAAPSPVPSPAPLPR
jgi:hypothetical protein